MFPQQVLNQPSKNSLGYIRQLLIASDGAIQSYYKLDAQLANFKFDKISNQKEQGLSSEIVLKCPGHSPAKHLLTSRI